MNVFKGRNYNELEEDNEAATAGGLQKAEWGEITTAMSSAVSQEDNAKEVKKETKVALSKSNLQFYAGILVTIVTIVAAIVLVVMIL